MKIRIILLLLALATQSIFFAQTPKASQLITIHRVNTTQMLSITGVDTGAVIYNTDSLCIFQFDGTTWIQTSIDSDADSTNELLNSIQINADSSHYNYANNTISVANAPRVFMGNFTINATGNLIINGLPFKPNLIQFIAYANVDSDTLDADNGVGNNNTSLQNSFGYMTGYAQNFGGVISQQVICGGGSGNSINDISRFASPNLCIGIRYGNQDGNKLGVTSAKIISFDTNGFTININSKADNLQIMYIAYR